MRAFLLLVALVVASACGDSYIPDAGDPSGVVLESVGAPCPCVLPSYVALEAGRFRDHWYRVDEDDAELVMRIDGVSTSIPTTLDSLTASQLSTEIVDGEDPLGLIFVAGCRDSDSIFVVFGDDDDTGQLDDKLGEYALGSTTRALEIVHRFSTGESFIHSDLGHPIVRLLDTTGDHVPDIFTDYAVPGISVPSGYEHLELQPGGILLCYSGEMRAPETEILVFRDANYDGIPESMSETTLGAHELLAPTYTYQPMVGDLSVPAIGVPGAVIELWETDENGDKVSTDPAVARLGSVTMPASGRGTISFTELLVEGEYLGLFDATNLLEGVNAVILATHPRATSVSPVELDQATGGSITISGSGFTSQTKVEIRSSLDRGVGLELVTTLVDGSTITAVVPTLSIDDWCWAATIWVYEGGGDDLPPSESWVQLLLK